MARPKAQRACQPGRGWPDYFDMTQARVPVPFKISAKVKPPQSIMQPNHWDLESP